MEAKVDAPCPLCGACELRRFVAVPDVPVHVGVLWPDAEAARSCRRGDLDLACCARCGFITNVAFDPDRVDYTQHYDNSLHTSARFREFEAALVARLVDRYGLGGGTAFEIGAGDGRFLSQLCGAGMARGVGVEPSFDADAAGGLDRGVQIEDAHFDPDRARGPYDLIACRQVLEHVPDPHTLVRGARDMIGEGSDPVVYFEVPNALMPLRDLSIWDLVYEHCSYFGAEPLRALFASHGFDVLDVVEDYDGQFLAVEARPGRPGDEPVEPDPAAVSELVRLVDAFGAAYARRRDDWQARLADLRTHGRRVTVWGGGARAVGFFNMVGIGDEVPFVVDINPNKQGTHVAGTGHPIVGPEHLVGSDVDLVVILNPIYHDEIASSLRDLGLDADLLVA